MKGYWDQRSIDHIAKHRVTPDEADHVLVHAMPPFPEEIGDGKFLVQGQTDEGRYLQVIFVYRPIDSITWSSLDWQAWAALLDEKADEVVYVIHSRELNESEKRALRRRL